METITLMIAEDHKIFREAINDYIEESVSYVKILGVAENGIELLNLVRKNVPDVVLLDIYMPEMSGWEVLEVFREKHPTIKTIMFSGEFDNAHVTRAILKGAAAYIDKRKGDLDEIIAAVESVYRYGYFFNDIVAQEIVLTLRKGKQNPIIEEASKFSDRELAVIEMICDGMQVKEIAASLKLSGGTIKFHKSNVFRKTESRTNMDLLKYAITRGIYNIIQPLGVPKKD